MEEQATPQTSESSEAPPSNAPEDFIGYVKWRKTGGELAAAPENQAPPAAAADTETTPPATTEPESGPEETQQEDEEEQEQEGQQPASRRGGQRQRKIDRLTRELAELKAQLAAVAPAKPAETPKAEPPPGKPKLDQFTTLEEYQEALTDWNITEREKRREAEAQAKAAAEAQAQLQSQWDSKQATARRAHPDFDEAIESVAAPNGPGVAAARQAMLEDEAGAEILYHLATHPDELKRIAALQPIAAVREIGRLSAILSPPPAVNGKQRFTAAPKPPPAGGRAGQGVSDSIWDPAVQNNFLRYVRARKAQMKDR